MKGKGRRERRGWATPVATLVAGLLLAIVLAMMPVRWAASLRGVAAAVLRPGQQAALVLCRCTDRAVGWTKSHFQSAARLAEVEEELKWLKQANRHLAAELAAVRSQAAAAAGSDDQQLLLVDSVEANVLGRQARAFLVRRHLLDVGSRTGIQTDALAVDAPVVIDRGNDTKFKPFNVVVSGRRVGGKIVEVGPVTSVVQPVTEPGFREVVQIAGAAQGILEGAGEPLCRIRRVEVTEPIAVGDEVTTATGCGVLPTPLLFGKIVRVDRRVGAAYWDIWMQPAVAPEGPRRVAVLRIELNPLRMAEEKRLGIKD